MFLNRTVPFALLAILVCQSTLFGAANARGTGDILVRVVGLRSNEGEVRLGLYDSAEEFGKGEGHAKYKGICQIKEYKCDFKFADIANGQYAVMVGHDVNKDGKIDRNPVSKELKGVSHYTGKLLSYPKFEKAKFEHNQAQTVIEIRVY